MPKNHLAQESSPYLQQHADNPVDWYPWGEEALNKAKQENKPILLSIGYSACHWCHVMAHESFEDEATAEVMNEYFINIKVDREERPDLDKIYQTAHQLLSQRAGGWPLTVFLTPEQIPFFAGTYFPKDKRYNMPTFVEILKNIQRAYIEQAAEINEQNQSLINALQQTVAQGDIGALLQAAPLDAARHQMSQFYDAQYGGFGQAPKFPHPTNIERCLRHWKHTHEQGHGDEEALNMAFKTLEAMARGGLYDQLGGGFFRYSTDEQWLIPHFEKMLYDNGPLLALYADAWAATDSELFERVALETGEWVMLQMQDDHGGYYSTLDADSEGEEGKYYVWRPQEVEAIIGKAHYPLFARHYGLDGKPNFEGNWHLFLQQPLSEASGAEQLQLAQDREHLLGERDKRVAPGLDDKVLTAWNGLMIRGMAHAGRLLERLDYIKSAQAAVDFIRQHCFKDGRLLASYKDGEARLMAYLDDYVFLLDGLLELLQARWRSEDMDFAIQLAEALLQHFADPQQGGFFYTADDHEQLIHRPKPFSDEAIPAGNGIAAQVLLRLGQILGETRYLDAAEATIKAAWGSLQQYPYIHGALLHALEEQLYGLDVVVIRSDHPEAWRTVVQGFEPRRLTLIIPRDAAELPPALAMKAAADSDRAYLCRGPQCSPPLASAAELELELARALATK